MKRKLLVFSLAIALLGGILAPSVATTANAASRSHAHAAAFDKTKFLLHLGAAYYAFHHFVYSPYKAGKLSRHHLFTVGKAVLALVFAGHEVHTAYTLAKNSNSKTLHVLIAPMTALSSTFAAIGAKFKHGQVSSSDVTALNGQTSSFSGLAKSHGFPIVDKKVSI
ncbi:MAG: hypothetical protein ACR2JC_17215 [Chloroflexota bacterium]|nr:MAG: hypothetical protein DLM70_05000 [Chloroflexota bacterium]